MPQEGWPKRVLRIVAALAMIWIGIKHFTTPAPFVRIVPSFLPAPLALVYVSGVFEILGGIGLLVDRVHKQAAWGLVALYIAVFPANINMAVNDIQPPDPADHIPSWVLWLRLPFQGLFIAWAIWLSRTKHED
jgi:uncharacterized membrane protein